MDIEQIAQETWEEVSKSTSVGQSIAVAFAKALLSKLEARPLLFPVMLDDERAKYINREVGYEDRIKQLEAEVAHWKNNHETEVRRARILKERTDMPIERVQAYERWCLDLAENEALRQQLTEMRESYDTQATEMKEAWARNAGLLEQLAEKDAEIEHLDRTKAEWKNTAKLLGEKLEVQLAATQKKDAEIERLKTVPMKYRRMAFNAQLQDENRELEKQLAASQAREQQLREALGEVADCPRAVRLLIEVARCADRVFDGNEEGTYINCSPDDASALSDALCELETLPDSKPGYTLSGPARAEWLLASYVSNIEALALPSDTTALSAVVTKAGEVMRERCAVTARTYGCARRTVMETEAAIRALPGVTLGDLK